MRAPTAVALSLTATLAAAASPASASASTPASSLSSQARIRIVHPPLPRKSDRENFSDFGLSAAPAGDVNGDGLADVIVGAPFASNNGRIQSGSSYVVFGRRDRARVDLQNLGDAGFRIDGPRPFLGAEIEEGTPVGELSGSAVVGLGDVNSDGLDDVAVGAPSSSASLRLFAGAVYVVFGRRSTAPVDLDDLGAGGYRIDGTSPFGTAGAKLARAGDVDGDGRADVAVSSQLVSSRTGADVYVVFGKADSRPVDLRELGRGGFGIRTPRSPSDDDNDEAAPYGPPLAGGADVNGDGRSDVLIALPGVDARGRDSAGSAFVVFGSASNELVRLTRLGSRGLRIDGADEEGYLGESSAMADDVNGDGLGDVVLGSQGERTYLIFGRRPPGRIDAGRLGRGGVVLSAPGDTDFGRAVGALPDVTGDGLSELLVGAPDAGRGCRGGVGAAYAIPGRRAGGELKVGHLGRRAFRLLGGSPRAAAGSSLGGLGDADGDGRADLFVVAPGATDLDSEERVLAPPWEAIVATGSPVGLREVSDRPPPPSRCIRVRLSTRDLDRIARTGRIRVRVTAAAEPAGERVYVWILGKPDLIGVGRGRVGSRGRAIVTVKLTPEARRSFRRIDAVRVVLNVSFGDGGRDRKIRVTLRR